MTCVHEFVEQNYTRLLDAANKFVGHELGGDLLNDILVTYLTTKKDRANKLCCEGVLYQYTIRAMQICGWSKNTPFYYKYLKTQERIAHGVPVEALHMEQKNNEDLEYQIEQVFCILQEIRWFDAEVFKAYHLHEHSIRTLSDATGISQNTLYKAIKTAQTYCKENRHRIR